MELIVIQARQELFIKVLVTCLLLDKMQPNSKTKFFIILGTVVVCILLSIIVYRKNQGDAELQKSNEQTDVGEAVNVENADKEETCDNIPMPEITDDASIEKGSMLTVFDYMEDGLLSPYAKSLAEEEDCSESFTWEILTHYEKMKMYSISRRILVWQGYFQFSAGKEYFISGKIANAVENISLAHIFINNKLSMSLHSGRDEGTSVFISKKEENHSDWVPIKIILTNDGSQVQHPSIELDYWEKNNPLNKKRLTPGELHHISRITKQPVDVKKDEGNQKENHSEKNIPDSHTESKKDNGLDTISIVSENESGNSSKKDDVTVVSSGALMWVYEYNDKGMPNPEEAPLEVVKDHADVFAWQNLSKHAETKDHAGKSRIIVWEGFLNVPEDGAYTFSVRLNDNSAAIANIIFMDKRLLAVGTGRRSQLPNAASKSLNLNSGDYPIKIVLTQYDTNRQPALLDFKFWKKQAPLMKYSIVPSKLICKTDN